MIRKRHQSGFALLMLVVVLLGLVFVGLASVLGSSVTQQNEERRAENRKVLLEAKEALLGYAVDYAVRDVNADGALDLYRMGKLPCPDIDGGAINEGSQDANCGSTSVNTIGYFPFKTVGKGKLVDSANECLWYIVSGDYKSSPDPGLLNWDTPGYLKLVDENGNLRHGASEDDFPIAFIISPGASIDQDRTTVAELPDCKANYNIASYLEGGPNLIYADTDDMPDTADTLWTILTTSEAANLNNEDYNDHAIAIYRNEWWDRVASVGDLSFDNSDTNPGPAPANTDLVSSSIEQLTRSLAECLAAYGNANGDRLLPFPETVDVLPANNAEPDEYRDRDFYNDDDSVRFGRFPQVLDNSEINTLNFVFDSGGTSYCQTVASSYDEVLWDNWKDHFFYIVSDDFDSDSSRDADDKCNSSSCIKVTANDKLAAMVIFAGRAEPGTSRIRWWDVVSASASVDEKTDVANYLEGDYQTGYTGGEKTFALEPDNYAYCVEYENSPPYELSAIKCADLDNIL